MKKRPCVSFPDNRLPFFFCNRKIPAISFSRSPPCHRYWPLRMVWLQPFVIWGFHSPKGGGLFVGRMNMFFLISLGTGAAYFFSPFLLDGVGIFFFLRPGFVLFFLLRASVQLAAPASRNRPVRFLFFACAAGFLFFPGRPLESYPRARIPPPLEQVLWQVQLERRSPTEGEKRVTRGKGLR